MFFLAAADGEGRPCGSYRRRAAGLHKVVGPASLAFPERSNPTLAWPERVLGRNDPRLDRE